MYILVSDFFEKDDKTKLAVKYAYLRFLVYKEYLDNDLILSEYFISKLCHWFSSIN